MTGLTLRILAYCLTLAAAALAVAGEHPKEHPTEHPKAAKPAKAALFERLGGLKGITQVVDDFIDRLVANEKLNLNPKIKAGRDSAPAPYLKFQVASLVCKVTGGPCGYAGRDMKAAHAHLDITEAEWDEMASDFKKSLDKFKVAKAEQDELFAIVGKTKADIVKTPAPAKP